MARTNLPGLVTELNELAAVAVTRAHLSGPNLRRVLSFIAKVAQVAEQAFQDVLAVLIEIKYLAPEDRRSGRVVEVQRQVALLTARSRFREAEEICSRLHHLDVQFRAQIAPLLRGVTTADTWEGVFGLIEEHEGRLISLVHDTVAELEHMLIKLDDYSLRNTASYAGKQAQLIRQSVTQLRDLSNRILGLSDDRGLLELTATGSDQEVMSAVLIHSGSLYVTHDFSKVGRTGSVGRGSSSKHVSVTETWQRSVAQIDLQQLAAELSTLRSAMRAEATQPQHDQALGAIAAAETAATGGNGAGALEHLKSGGRWALDVATKIDVTVASSALKTSLGL